MTAWSAVSNGKISLHIHTGGNAAACVRVYEECARAGTPIPLALVINNPSLVNEIKRVSPETFVVLRDGVVGGQDVLPLTPNNADANKAAGRARFAQRYAVCDADAYQIANEHYNKAHPAWMVEAMRQFYIGAMEAAEVLETLILVGDFGVGGPEDEHLPLLQPMLDRAQQHGHILNYHGYCKPGSYDIRQDAEWFAMRWLRIVAKNPALRVIIGECGGFYNNGPDIMGMMKTYQVMLAPYTTVIGAAVFSANPAEDWRAAGFDFDPHLSEFAAWHKSLGKGSTMPVYTSPVDPSTSDIFANGWYDATGFAVKYHTSAVAEAIHTGHDMNLARDGDAHKPVFAIADGVVTAVRRYSTWGWIVVIHHTPAGGPYVYARYAHVESIRVQEGQTVKRGDQIAQIGNADGVQPFHLHFDVSGTDVLLLNPAHWPGLNREEVLEHYVDGARFLRGQVIIAVPDPAKVVVAYTTDRLRLRALASTAATTLTILDKDAPVQVTEYNAAWYKRVAGGYLSRQYMTLTKPTPIPVPDPVPFTVYTTDRLRVRALPTTAADTLTILDKDAPVNVLEENASWYKRVATGYISRAYTTTKAPSAWRPPITATMRGVHASAGGWSPDPQKSPLQLPLVRANTIKFVLIVGYENQPQAIAAFKSAGVEQFVFRAAVHNPEKDGYPVRFCAVTLPILKNYAATLPNGSQDMMICLGNEPNLYQEGAGTWWQDGAEFAAWWHTVATEFRKQLPGCKLGFPAMSPGGETSERMDEENFIFGARSAISTSDWVGVHYYWQKADGSDISPPLTMWRKQFAGKVLLGTEIGPANATTVTNEAVKRAYDEFTLAGIPITQWLLEGAGMWQNAEWVLHDIRV